MTSHDSSTDFATKDAGTKDFAALSAFITDLFCRIDDAMTDVPKHSQAKFYPSELVTLGLLLAHQDWTRRFLSEPTLLGVADSYGIELIHPRREGRSDKQIGKKGQSNLRWIVGAKLCFVLNRFGLVVDWTMDTANVSDKTFQPLIAQFEA